MWRDAVRLAAFAIEVKMIPRKMEEFNEVK
jgi:hypothetical protein